MGYNTRFDGEISFHPPIPWSEVEGTPFDSTQRPPREVQFNTVDEKKTEDGWEMTRRLAVGIVATYASDTKSYSIVEHLQELLDRWAEGRTFYGRIDAEGGDTGDMWRLCVRNGRAVKVTPVITWPDEGDSS